MISKVGAGRVGISNNTTVVEIPMYYPVEFDDDGEPSVFKAISDLSVSELDAQIKALKKDAKVQQRQIRALESYRNDRVRKQSEPL